jgi:hypothetical protein
MWTYHEIADNYPEGSMKIEFDDHGKYFTDIISKTPISDLIRIWRQLISN